jgi:hypothetical protein
MQVGHSSFLHSDSYNTSSNDKVHIMGHRAVWFVSGGADAVRFGLGIRAASELEPRRDDGRVDLG